jgi:hypothetical protein
MANTQYVCSSSCKRALDIGVRWNIGHHTLFETQRRAFDRRSDVLTVIDAWLAQHGISDARTCVWGLGDLPWEMWIRSRSPGDPDLVFRPGWTLDAVAWGPDDRAVGVLAGAVYKSD